MAAQIIQLESRRSKRRLAYTGCNSANAPRDPARQPGTGTPVPQFQFWTGASGDRYVHTIYPLLTCPQLPAGNFILVKRTPDGTCRPLAIGRTSHKAPSLNLAQIRHLAARLGANEVHAHLLANGHDKAKLVEYDIGARYFAAPQNSAARH